MKMKRVLALILSSVMICTAVPGEVMAAEIELESEGEFSDEVEELTEPEEEIPSEAVDEVELQNEELDETQALELKIMLVEKIYLRTKRQKKKMY